MKVIIIDDESYVVDTIELLVDWERFHITQRFVANTVQTAIGILDREKPDLAFVDVVLDDRLGSIEVGKKAHFAVYQNNPIEDIHHLLQCDMPIKNGEILWKR